MTIPHCAHRCLADEAFTISEADLRRPEAEWAPAEVWMCTWPTTLTSAPPWMSRQVGPSPSINPERDCVGCPVALTFEEPPAMTDTPHTRAVEAAAEEIHQKFGYPNETWDLQRRVHADIFRKEAGVTIRAYLAAMEAEGFVLLPKEPTGPMKTAMAAQYRQMLPDAYIDGPMAGWMWRAGVEAVGKP